MLVLSLFPGIGLLDMAFEQEGFAVAQSRDWIMGGDVRKVHYPSGRFDGVIGGPPCQAFSSLVHLNRSLGVEPKFGNLVPEFARVVNEAEPEWFVMENVPDAPTPEVDGYRVIDFCLRDDLDCGGATQRQRRITWGDRRGRLPEFELKLIPEPSRELAVTGSARRISVGGNIRRRENGIGTAPGYSARLTVDRMAELQGLPPGFLDRFPFTESAKRQMIGNGVPLPMGRAIARAVKEAIGFIPQS